MRPMPGCAHPPQGDHRFGPPHPGAHPAARQARVWCHHRRHRCIPGASPPGGRRHQGHGTRAFGRRLVDARLTCVTWAGRPNGAKVCRHPVASGILIQRPVAGGILIQCCPVAKGKAIHERPAAGGTAIQRPVAGGFFMQATEPTRRSRGDLPWLAAVVVTGICGLGGLNRGVCVGERWRPCCFAGLDSARPLFLQSPRLFPHMLESHAAMSSRGHEQHRSHARPKEAWYSPLSATSPVYLKFVCRLHCKVFSPPWGSAHWFTASLLCGLAASQALQPHTDSTTDLGITGGDDEQPSYLCVS